MNAQAPRQGGFTLLEVLAAMVLLALLMLGIYAGIRTATATVRAGSAAIERNEQLAAAQQFLRRELSQVLAQTIGHGADGSNVVFVGGVHELRYVAPLPGYLNPLGPQLQQVQLVPDGAGGLRLEVRLGMLAPDGGSSLPLGEPQVLVDGIIEGRFSYTGTDAAGRPVTWTSTWPEGQQLPSLVRINLRLRGNASWPEMLIPLRLASTTALTSPVQAGEAQ